MDDDELKKANELARENTGVDVSAYGSSGLAGLRRLVKSKLVQQGERCGIIFTGAGLRKCGLPAVQSRIFILNADDDVSKLAK